MSGPWRVTIALWIVSAALFCLAVAAAVALGGGPEYAWLALACTVAVGPWVAGFLAVRHDPGNWVGVWLTAAGANLMLQMSHGNWQEALAADPDSLPGYPLLFVLTQGVWMGWFVPFAMVLVLFPDGRVEDRLGRLAAWALVLLPVAFNLLLSIVPGPLMPPLADWPRPLGTHPIGYAAIGVLPLFLAALITAAVSVRRRRARTSDPRRRDQLRWMLMASLGVPVTLLLCWASYLLVQGPGPVVAGLIFMNLSIPAAALIAMLRHDLYDVDRAAVQVGAYAVLAFGVILGWAGIAAFVGRALGEGSVTGAVVATAVVMLALRPARTWLLDRLGRRLHPREAAGRDAVLALSERVHAGTDAPERLEEVLRDALRDHALRVGYRRPGGSAFVDVRGEEVPTTRGEPIRALGHEVGIVVPGPGQSAVPDRVARAAGLLADSVRLRGEVATALAEAEAGRERLLEAETAERRRLERDLHDGAQQRLVSLGMRLRVLQRRAAAGEAVDVDALVDDAVDQIGSAVGELRAIAHGLRPSCLDEGLAAALEGLTRSSALPVDVRHQARDLPDHVGLTAYYVASEAVANAVKHAACSRIEVEVREHGDRVLVAVCDDGVGGATMTPGSGLAMLRDRVAAIGGALHVGAGAAGGTRVEAVLPCGS
ncbi:hypothetical protein GCM10027425_24060 [Alteromonas gracilis]